MSIKRDTDIQPFMDGVLPKSISSLVQTNSEGEYVVTADKVWAKRERPARTFDLNSPHGKTYAMLDIVRRINRGDETTVQERELIRLVAENAWEERLQNMEEEDDKFMAREAIYRAKRVLAAQVYLERRSEQLPAIIQQFKEGYRDAWMEVRDEQGFVVLGAQRLRGQNFSRLQNKAYWNAKRIGLAERKGLDSSKLPTIHYADSSRQRRDMLMAVARGYAWGYNNWEVPDMYLTCSEELRELFSKCAIQGRIEATRYTEKEI